MDGRYFRNRKYRKKKFRVRILAIKDAKHCQNPAVHSLWTVVFAE